MTSSSTYSRDEVIAAVTDYYRFFVTLPYADPDAVVHAPKDGGWSNINVTELKKRGKTDEVIELLRHLPYLEHPFTGGAYTIDAYSECIQYHKGMCYHDYIDSINALPGYVIPISMGTDRDGSWLLVDTRRGNITKYNIMGYDVQASEEFQNSLAEDEKWRAYQTVPVGQWFERWKKLYEKLIWMVAPTCSNDHDDNGTYFSRADHDEDELLEADEDEENVEFNEDPEIPDQYIKGVYAIYKRNGWLGSSYDREARKAELEEYLKDADI